MTKKRTVAQLSEELEKLKEAAGDIKVSVSVVYHWEQVATVFEEYSRYGELVKMEVQPSHSPGKRSYICIVMHRPLMNIGKRDALMARGFYAGLEASADRYFPKKK